MVAGIRKARTGGIDKLARLRLVAGAANQRDKPRTLDLNLVLDGRAFDRALIGIHKPLP